MADQASTGAVHNSLQSEGGQRPSDLATHLGRPSSPVQALENSNVESPEYCGPSSSEFTLNMVSGNLKAMGIPTAILDKTGFRAGDVFSSSSRLTHHGSFMRLLNTDPLWGLRKEDAFDLINSWFSGVGMLYPIVTRDTIMETAENVFRSLEYAQKDGIKSRAGFLAETIFSDETNKLKVVLAIGRNLESGGRNDQAQRLFHSITEAVEDLIWNSNGIHGIQLLALVVSAGIHSYLER